MVKRFMKFPFAVLTLIPAAAGAVTPADAIDAGYAAGNVDWSAVTANRPALDAVAGMSGNTEDLKALRQGGQAKLYAPGRSEADRCATAGDPKCLAVQVVDRTGHAGPTVNPDVTGDLMKGYDDVVGSAEDRVDFDGTGTSTGDCRPATTVVTPPETTQTCDVRVTASDEIRPCRETTESFFSPASRWYCRITEAHEETATCVLPVVVPQRKTFTVACREGKRDPEVKTCPATVTTAVKSVWEAACTRPVWKKVTKTCTRRLLVKPAATCRVGEAVSAVVTDYGFLGEDAVPGADALELEYRCAARAFPILRIKTDSATKGARDRVFETSDAVFDFFEAHGGHTLRFDGTLTCGTDNVCTAVVTMTVYRGSGRWTELMGHIKTTLNFTKYVKTGETEYWEETCTEE